MMVTLLDLTVERSIDLESADLSVLSVEVLDSLLLCEFVSVGNSDAVL
jgi:hypothetical protein